MEDIEAEVRTLVIDLLLPYYPGQNTIAEKFESYSVEALEHLKNIKYQEPAEPESSEEADPTVKAEAQDVLMEGTVPGTQTESASPDTTSPEVNTDPEVVQERDWTDTEVMQYFDVFKAIINQNIEATEM